MGRRQFHRAGHRQAEQGRSSGQGQGRSEGFEFGPGKQIEQRRAGHEPGAARFAQDRRQDPDVGDYELGLGRYGVGLQCWILIDAEPALTEGKSRREPPLVGAGA